MQQIYGWRDSDSLARELSSSVFSGLLDGYLVFAYRNQKKTGTLGELIVSKRVKGPGYMVGIKPFSKGWTGFLPNVPVEYLMETSLNDLLENKTEKEIIESFIENIGFYEERE